MSKLRVEPLLLRRSLLVIYHQADLTGDLVQKPLFLIEEYQLLFVLRRGRVADLDQPPADSADDQRSLLVRAGA